MMKNEKDLRMLRRSFLATLGSGVAGSLLLPVLARAQLEPKIQRFLLIHRPCGSQMNLWWPSGGVKDWSASPLLSSFDALRDDMVILKGINCPRVQAWIGDKHGAGMIAMMAPPPPDPGPSLRAWPMLPGHTAVEQTDTNAQFITSPDKTIDQLFIEKIPALQGTMIPSVQLTGSSESADLNAHASVRVVSYAKPDPIAPYAIPLWPEYRPEEAFKNIFGVAGLGLDPAQLSRLHAQRRSVLDYIAKDLSGLKGRVPSSQRPKVDAHLTSIRELEQTLTRNNNSKRQCTAPTLAQPPPAQEGIGRNDRLHHWTCLQQMNIIKTMFQCDLTRVASFTFGYGNSSLRLANVLDVAGLRDHYRDQENRRLENLESVHSISHYGGPNPQHSQFIIEKFYCDMTARLLIEMKNTPDGDGDSLLDNTLVVFWNECSDGDSHATNDLPVLLFGGKFLGLRGGSYLSFSDRFMSDFWVQTAQAWGYEGMTSYGDAIWNRGSLPGIFG